MANCNRYTRNLSSYLDGELGRKEMLKLTRHLADCPHCREELSKLEELSALISANNPEYGHIHPRFKDMLMDRIRREEVDIPRSKKVLPLIDSLIPALRPALLAPALAGLLLISGISVYFLFTRTVPPETGRIADRIEQTEPELELAHSLDLYLYQHRSHTRGNAPIPVQLATYTTADYE